MTSESEKAVSPREFSDVSIERRDVSAQAEAAKAEIWEKIESDAEGINAERIRAFLEGEGLSGADILFLTDEEAQKFKAILERHGYLGYAMDLDDSNVTGSFLRDLDLVYIRRPQVHHDVAETIDAEGFAVHELAHSSSRREKFVRIEKNSTVVKFTRPRCGFSVDVADLGERSERRGAFFEEGFADALRARYLRENADDDWIAEYGKAANVPGIDASTFKHSTINAVLDTKDIPLVYMYLHGTTTGGHPTFSVPSLAGTALEAMMQTGAFTFEELKEARRDTKGLRSMQGLIDRVSPGLYAELRRIPYTAKDFATGLTRVQGVIAEGQPSDRETVS